MAHIGKVVNSVFQFSQEATAALVSLQFDFSIIKIEAPPEYAGLGTSLSKKRKFEAEEGLSHATARRLGALFETELPKVPQLVSAYGHRVTEIAASSEVNPRGSSADGPFADYVGADGTTIWAAASSGTSAICVHLLACMLARIWSPGEAISIWLELVRRRCEVLQQQTSNSADLQTASLLAARNHLSRTTLATWDASARAWLRTADQAMKLQQTQLRLISDNISLPIPNEDGLYDSVLACWTMAMSALDSIISGKPRRIQAGGILLALTAWHIYPDMSVQVSNPQYIKLNDALVKQGGVVTIGLENGSANLSEGVSWSLPLTHLKYYGKPALTTRGAGIDQTQLTFKQFICVALGSLFHSWQLSTKDRRRSAEVIKLLSAKCRDENWLRTLARGADYILASEGIALDECQKLMAYGSRQCSRFLGQGGQGGTYGNIAFGLASFPIAMNLLKAGESRTLKDGLGTQRVERQVEFLRIWAGRSKYDLSAAIICYYSPSSDINDPALFSTNAVRYAKGGKRKRHPTAPIIHKEYSHWSTGLTRASFDPPDVLASDTIQDQRTLTLRGGDGQAHEEFLFVCGDPTSAALYIPKRSKHRPRVRDNALNPKDLLFFLQEDAFDPMLLAGMLRPEKFQERQPLFSSLFALATADEIFAGLTDASVDIRVCQLSMHETRYAAYVSQQLLKYKGRPKDGAQATLFRMSSDLSVAFSCIALLQTGQVDIDPQDMQEAIAISYRDSIFVAERLLCDPYYSVPFFPVRRIIGNVGKAGLVVLVPPSAPPEVRIQNNESWSIINHHPFDGKYENNFVSTSSHIEFTGYEIPINIKDVGILTHDAHFVETVIRTYEGKSWVADLDILKAVNKYVQGWDSSTLSTLQSEAEGQSSEQQLSSNRVIAARLISVDNWSEFLDRPSGHAVVRASGDELARLALATVAAQKGYNFRIISPEDRLKYVPKEPGSPEAGPQDSAPTFRYSPDPKWLSEKSKPKDKQMREDDMAVLMAIDSFDPLSHVPTFESDHEDLSQSETESPPSSPPSDTRDDVEPGNGPDESSDEAETNNDWVLKRPEWALGWQEKTAAPDVVFCRPSHTYAMNGGSSTIAFVRRFAQGSGEVDPTTASLGSQVAASKQSPEKDIKTPLPFPDMIREPDLTAVVYPVRHNADDFEPVPTFLGLAEGSLENQ